MIHPITKDIALALKCLANGDLVSFPTETVYGLGADAQNPQAIQKVFQAKGRPADHPLIVHLSTSEQLPLWATDIPESAWLLAKHFWPGPLTMILRKQPQVSTLITGGQDTIGIRIPNHALTLELINRFGSGLVGPSANKYGRVSPTTAEHVATDLATEVAAILDGGPCSIGIESTIIYLAADQPMILRQGMISAQQISEVLGCNVAEPKNTTAIARSSGSHESHYAPITPVYLIAGGDLLQQVKHYQDLQQTVSVLSFQAKPTNLAANIYWQQVPNDPHSYAHYLYANLRQHDELGNHAILIEQVANNTEWAAVIDRLLRASTR